ncbi:MAG: hypothetical protein JXA93_16095 [Anaerolineae bacterium]|nr:hypothetical protein [Anaerolineae bacterium]
MTLFAGLDLGTTTIAGVLLDVERGDVHHVAHRRNDAALAPGPPTRAGQDPARILALALDHPAPGAAGAAHLAARSLP